MIEGMGQTAVVFQAADVQAFRHRKLHVVAMHNGARWTLVAATMLKRDAKRVTKSTRKLFPKARVARVPAGRDSEVKFYEPS